jgi:demethylmenaquinone methyltransferase / 2-methoxy-6-polyprenyl-1,4-benzoquinol methylase
MGAGEGHTVALEIFRGLAKDYERALDTATFFQDRYWKRWLAEKASIRRSDLVLDVGCGTMVLEEKALRRDCRVVGVDLTEQMLRLGQKKRLGNIDGLLNSDAEALPFGDGVFDAVVSCYVAKYVDPRRFVEEAARVVKPAGRVVIYDFVRPRGAYRLPLQFYLQGGLRPVGALLGMARSGATATFRELPGIVGRATWDEGLEFAAGSSGLKTLSLRRLTGGVVVAYAGVKSGERAYTTRPGYGSSPS